MLRQFRTLDNRKLWLDLSQALEVRETGKKGEYIAVFPMDYNHAYTIREFIGIEEDVKASIGTETRLPESFTCTAVEPASEFGNDMSKVHHFTVQDIKY